MYKHDDGNKQAAIEVFGLSKRYILKNEEKRLNKQESTFFALKDISFTVNRGDVIAIIGSNGSGKSTLLKILSGISKPTSGEARFYGSVTSILDIGNNVHPDLTGHENVIMHFKLANIPSSEFEKLSNEVKMFSGVGDFFYQPVKFYSDGMFLRLAFSLVFHLSVDILLLDEVLSVGDEGFRLKCFDLLQRLTEQGKTILFVSHNRLEILELSDKCIWLDKGEVKKMGHSPEILSEYFAMHRNNFDTQKLIIDTETKRHPKQDEGSGFIDIVWNANEAPGNELMAIHGLSVKSLFGSEKLINTEPIVLKFTLFKKKAGTKIGAFFFLQDVFYQPVLVGHFLNNLNHNDFSNDLKNQTGIIEIKCTIPANFLFPGKYYFLPRFGMEQNEWNSESEEAFRFSEELHFTVYSDNNYQDIVGDISKGSVRPPLEWEVKKMD